MASIALSSAQDEVRQPGQVVLFFRYLRRNKSLGIGLAVLLLLVAFTVIGLLVSIPSTPIR